MKPYGMMRKGWMARTAVMAAALLASVPATAQSEKVAAEVRNVSGIAFDAQVEAELWQLRITGPDGAVRSLVGETPPSVSLFTEEGEVLASGVYTYELVAIESAEEVSTRGEERFRAASLRGNFRVDDGLLWDQSHNVPGPLSSHPQPGHDLVGEEDGLQIKRSADTSLVDDFCIGNACLANEQFPLENNSTGYLKLKGLATGLIFSDTNASGPGSNVDWQLAANDGNGSGANFFAVYNNGESGDSGAFNASNAVVPFRIDSGAPTASLHVDNTGRVGLGTATPSRDLEITSPDPAVVFNDTAGRSWSLNDSDQSTEFDIVSTATGSAPVRHLMIHHNAPEDQLILAQSGIGVGTEFPSATIEVEGSSGTSQILVDEQGANASVEVMFNLVCNCAPGFRMQNSTNGEVWFFRHTSAGDFAFDNVGGSGLEVLVDRDGNLTAKGMVSGGSSRALKEDLTPSSSTGVLETLADLNLFEWSYIGQSARHFGPMAEDFAALFGLGEVETRLAAADVAGVALAAIQELEARSRDQLQLLRNENSDLRRQLEELRALVLGGAESE